MVSICVVTVVIVLDAAALRNLRPRSHPQLLSLRRYTVSLSLSLSLSLSSFTFCYQFFKEKKEHIFYFYLYVNLVSPSVISFFKEKKNIYFICIYM